MRLYILIFTLIYMSSCVIFTKEGYDIDKIYIHNNYIDLGIGKEITLTILKTKFYDRFCQEGENCFSLYIVQPIDHKDTFLIYDNSLERYNIKDTVMFSSNKKMLKDYPRIKLPSVTEEQKGRVMVISEVYSNKYRYCIGTLIKR